MQTATITKSVEGVVRRADITQELAYYPYGGLRIDNQYSSIDNPKKFTGFELDRETNLNYAGARYYDQDIGRFTSQDPVALSIGDWEETNEKTAGQLDFYIKNPQSHNSYSYGFNNPLIYQDKNGEFAVGIGFSLNGNIPGIYAQTTDTFVLAFDTNTGKLEAGWVKSVSGGPTSAVLGSDVTGNFVVSPDAQSVSDFEGVDVTAGASARTFIGPTLGGDASVSKGEDGNTITTYSVSAGVGFIATPYVVPVEVHGGLEYSDVITSYELYNPERKKEKDNNND